MFCMNCGAELGDYPVFCPKCGMKLDSSADENAQTNFLNVSPNFAVAVSLTVLSLFFNFYGIVNYISLIFSIKAARSCKKSNVLEYSVSIICLIISIIFILISLSFISMNGSRAAGGFGWLKYVKYL